VCNRRQIKTYSPIWIKRRSGDSNHDPPDHQIHTRIYRHNNLIHREERKRKSASFMGFPAKNKSEDWRDRLGWGERERKSKLLMLLTVKIYLLSIWSFSLPWSINELT